MKKLILILMIFICMFSVFADSTQTAVMNTATNLWQTTATPSFSVTCTGNNTLYNVSIWTDGVQTGTVDTYNWHTNTSTITYDVANGTTTTITFNETVPQNYTTGLMIGATCEPSDGARNEVTVYTSNITVLIDSVSPTDVAQFGWHICGGVCIDAVPEIEFNSTNETSFNYYLITLKDQDDESINSTTRWYNQYGTNGTGSNIKINLSLPRTGSRTNITVAAYDKAGNSFLGTEEGQSKLYYHNSTGYELAAGWNVLGIVRDDDVNLSDISSETGASVVAMYNNSAGSFTSYTVGTSTNADHILKRVADTNTSRNNVFIYMDAAGTWEGCGRNFSTSAIYGDDILYNNSNNDWNVVGITRPEITFNDLNVSLDGESSAASYVNYTDQTYYSYFIANTYNQEIKIKRGEVLFILSNSSSNYNWTNQTLT